MMEHQAVLCNKDSEKPMTTLRKTQRSILACTLSMTVSPVWAQQNAGEIVSWNETYGDH